MVGCHKDTFQLTYLKVYFKYLLAVCPSLTVDRVTDHAVNINHSVIRNNHQSRPGIAGDDRQGHSFIYQHGW